MRIRIQKRSGVRDDVVANDLTICYKNGLTIRARRFVIFYCGVCNYNGGRAAVMAGFSENNPQTISYQLLKNPMVQEEIKLHQDREATLADLDEKKLLEELAKIILADPRQFYDDEGNLKPITELGNIEAGAISKFQVTEKKNRHGKVLGTTFSIQKIDRRQAIVDYGHHIGMFVERKEDVTPTDFNIILVGDGKGDKPSEEKVV